MQIRMRTPHASIKLCGSSCLYFDIAKALDATATRNESREKALMKVRMANE